MRALNETDKVIIALGFFTIVGFIAYLYFLKVPSPSTGTVASANWTVLKDENGRVRSVTPSG